MLNKTKLLAKAKHIKLVICDVDGVLTDSYIYIHSSGGEMRAFSVHDGLAIKLFLQAGIEVAIISAKKTAAVTKRAKSLGVPYVYQGYENKREAYIHLKQRLHLKDSNIAYIGDDLQDLPIIRMAGLGIAVANATTVVKQHADYVTKKAGGHGAVREVCELILTAQKKLKAIYQQFL